MRISNRETLKWCVLALTVLTFLVACSGQEAASDSTLLPPNSSPAATDTAVPTATAAATDTLEPTEPPMPTETPKPTEGLMPSSTPVDTKIPVPTVPALTTSAPTVPAPTAPASTAPPSTAPAPTAPNQTQPPAGGDAYLQDLKTIFTAYPEAVNNLNGLMQDPRPDDAAWMKGMETNITTVKGVYENVRDMTPPENMAGPHAGLTDALGTCNGVADVALDGFRRQDRGTLEGAAKLADSCRDQLKGALDILNQYGAGLSAPPFAIPAPN